MTRHVYPINDIRAHDTTTALCPCMPELLEDGAVVRHNSYDGREVGDVCREALDLLGRALVEHKHVWNGEERAAYDHAIALLSMHWPEKIPAADQG